MIDFINYTEYEKILFFLAVPSTIIFLFFTLFTLIGMGDLDLDHDSEYDDGIGFFSIKTVSIFIMVFSWCSLFMINLNAELIISFIVSLALSITVIYHLRNLFTLLNSLKEEKTFDPTAMIGNTAKVVFSIKPGGKGKIEIEYPGGGTTEYFAINLSEHFLNKGDIVNIVKYSDGIYSIQP